LLSYFDTPQPRLLAHRGLAQRSGLDENTIPAFLEALEFGATHLESDTQATKDGHALLLHDSDLSRVAGIDAAVEELTLEQVSQIRLANGGQIPTLAQALRELPEAKFNIDVKTRAAIEPTVHAIEQANAHERVLLSSFSNPIRRKSLSGLSRSVATSASQSIVIAAYLSHKILLGLGFGRIVRDVHAFQIPTAKGPINFADPAFIRRLQLHQTEVHFWTINNPQEANKLIAMGADGIVSDRVDLMNLRET